MTTTNTAAVETMRAAIGQLLNEFGERQWQSGRGVPHKSLEEAFDAIIERAALAAPAQPVANVSQETFNGDGTSDIIIPAPPIGMALDAAPVKRTVWVNLYGRQLESVCHPTEEDADKHASPNRIGGKAYPLEIEEGAQAAPVDAAVQQDAERLDFMIESCTQVATISPSGRKYLCYPDGRMQAGSYPTARAAIDAAAQKGTND